MSKFKKFFQLVFLALALTACGSKAPQQVRVNIGAEPHSLDPRKIRDLQSQTISKMFFDGLTRVNQQEKIELAVADAVEVSEDGKIYTFHLRDTKWSNGDPVTAQDFAYSWKRALDPNFPSDEAFQMYAIKNAKLAKEGKLSLEEVGISVINEKTLQIELEDPTPYFLELLAFHIFYPINQKVDIQTPNWSENANTYVCNGPFMPKEWKHSDKIDVVKNPTYWDASVVCIEQLELVMVNETVELMMFEKKELDWAGSPLSVLPLDALPELKQTKGMHTKPFLATYFLRTNLYRPPFNHPLMRKAFAMAIDRAQIVKHVLHGNQMVATSLVPPCLGLQEEPYFADGDVETARMYFDKALAELEMKKSDLPKISVLYVASDRSHIIMQAIQQFWNDAFGVEIELQPIERKVYFDKVSKMDFHLAVSSWTADFNDPINFLEVFRSKNNGSNNTGWENPTYREFLDRSTHTADLKDRHALLQASEQILMDAMPIIPVFHYNMLFMKDDRLEGVVISNLGGIDFKWAYRKGE